MKKYRVLYAFAVLAILSFASCKKDNVSPHGSLDGISEAQIKNLMVGRWKLLYTHHYVPRDTIIKLDNYFWDITTMDTLTITEMGTIFNKNKIKYVNDNDTYGKWLMTDFTTGTGTTNEYLDSLKLDTLVTTYSGIGTRSYFVKQ